MGKEVEMGVVGEGIEKVGMGIQPSPLGCSQAHLLVGVTFYSLLPTGGPESLPGKQSHPIKKDNYGFFMKIQSRTKETLH